MSGRGADVTVSMTEMEDNGEVSSLHCDVSSDQRDDDAPLLLKLDQ